MKVQAPFKVSSHQFVESKQRWIRFVMQRLQGSTYRGSFNLFDRKLGK